MNPPVEISFHADKLPANANPFADITLDVVFTDPDGATKKVPAFWAGGNQWKVRYASPVVGMHAYRSICSDPDDAGLHGVERSAEITAYTGDNPLYKHGPLQVSADKRHFEHADGTPFLWLADTWWKALSERLSWEGFQELCVDRSAKGFNTVQIVCGPYPDEDAFDPGWANEGGMPYENREYTLVNPKYFDYADRRLVCLVEAGLMPALVGAWGRSDCNAMKVAGVEGLKRYWRYLVARYAAYPLVLIPGGEVPGVAKYGEGDWGEVVKYLCELDPFKRLKSSHEYACPLREETPLNDFELVGGSHLSPKSAHTLSVFTTRYNERPTMPLVCGETGYEGHMQRHFADTQRYVFWMYILSGAAGHTYGAAGLHHMGVEGDPGLKPIWDYTTWQQAKDFPGAAQVGMGGKLLQDYNGAVAPFFAYRIPHLGMVDVPETGNSFILTAAACGDYVAMTVDDGERSYHTSPVKVANVNSGQLGLWRSDVGEPQQYRNVKVSKTPFASPPEDEVQDGLHLIRSGEDVAPSIPSPQDWVLVLEKEMN